MTSSSSRKASGAFCLGGFGMGCHYDNAPDHRLPDFPTVQLPETIQLLKGKPETGMLPAGMIPQVTGDGHGYQRFGVSPSAFSRQSLGASSRWPNGWQLNSRCPYPSPDTRSAASTFALLHRSTAPICTFALSLPLGLGPPNHVPSRLSGLPMVPPLSSASPCARCSSIV